MVVKTISFSKTLCTACQSPGKAHPAGSHTLGPYAFKLPHGLSKLWPLCLSLASLAYFFGRLSDLTVQLSQASRTTVDHPTSLRSNFVGTLVCHLPLQEHMIVEAHNITSQRICKFSNPITLYFRYPRQYTDVDKTIKTKRNKTKTLCISLI